MIDLVRLSSTFNFEACLLLKQYVFNLTGMVWPQSWKSLQLSRRPQQGAWNPHLSHRVYWRYQSPSVTQRM